MTASTSSESGHRAAVPKVVATDLDGTLLRADGTTSAFTNDTLTTAARRGVEVVPVTARRPCTTFRAVAVANWAVCLNGALVCQRDGSVLLEHTLSRANAVELERALTRAEPLVRVSTCMRDELFATPAMVTTLPRYRRTNVTVVASLAELPAGDVHAVSVRHADLSADDIAELVEPYIDSAAMRVRASGPGSVSVMPTTASKAAGAQAVAEMLKVAVDDVVAYGDMPTDIDLLQWAGLGVAVANAHPSAAAAADTTAGSADRDGVARHLRTLLSLDPGTHPPR